MAVFDSAKATFRSNPECSVRSKTKISDGAFTKAVLSRIEFKDRTLVEIRYPTVTKTEPEARFRRIAGYDSGVIISANGRPGDLLQHSATKEMKEPGPLSTHPQVT